MPTSHLSSPSSNITASDRTTRRVGFTLVELLVVITIIGMLVALLLPAVQNARRTAQQTQCLNRAKQLGLAMQTYETSKGQLPGYIQSVKRSDQNFARMTYSGNLENWVFQSTDAPGESRVSWVTMLLPNLDGQAIWDNVVDGTVHPLGATLNDERAEIRPIEELICPADLGLTALSDFGGTSYSVNTGGWDLDNSGSFIQQSATAGDIKSNGIFQNQVAAKKAKTRLSSLKSASGTIMLSENQHKVLAESASDPGNYTWFGVSPETGVTPTQGLYGEQQLGLVWVAQFDQPIVTTPQGSYTVYEQAAFNSEEPSPEDYRVDKPLYARPNANHASGVFNVIFADGHGLSINPDIDYTVYQRLMTTDQRKCVDPIDHDKLDQVGQYRVLAPLVQADYE